MMELFVFFHIGADRDRIFVRQLGSATEALSVRPALLRAGASKAQCYLRRDREHLLAVIESGFGSLEPFDKLIRGLFSEHLLGGRARQEAAPQATSQAVELESAAAQQASAADGADRHV